MGWGTGSIVMDGLIDALKENVPEHDLRVKLYTRFISVLEDCDWGTHDDCLGVDKAFDEALRKIYPDWEV